MSLSETTVPYQLTPWKPGQSGNPAGRPVGSRNKLGEHFIQDVYDHWKRNGIQAIQTVFEKRPHEYLKVVASLLPKEFHITELPTEGLTADDLAGIIEAIRTVEVEPCARISDDRVAKASRKGKRGAVTYSVRP